MQPLTVVSRMKLDGVSFSIKLAASAACSGAEPCLWGVARSAKTQTFEPLHFCLQKCFFSVF